MELSTICLCETLWRNNKHEQNEYKEEVGGICIDGSVDGSGGGLFGHGVGKSLFGDG